MGFYDELKRKGKSIRERTTASGGKAGYHDMNAMLTDYQDMLRNQPEAAPSLVNKLKAPSLMDPEFDAQLDAALKPEIELTEPSRSLLPVDLHNYITQREPRTFFEAGQAMGTDARKVDRFLEGGVKAIGGLARDLGAGFRAGAQDLQAGFSGANINPELPHNRSTGMSPGTPAEEVSGATPAVGRDAFTPPTPDEANTYSYVTPDGQTVTKRVMDPFAGQPEAQAGAQGMGGLMQSILGGGQQAPAWHKEVAAKYINDPRSLTQFKRDRDREAMARQAANIHIPESSEGNLFDRARAQASKLIPPGSGVSTRWENIARAKMTERLLKGSADRGLKRSKNAQDFAMREQESLRNMKFPPLAAPPDQLGQYSKLLDIAKKQKDLNAGEGVADLTAAEAKLVHNMFNVSEDNPNALAMGSNVLATRLDQGDVSQQVTSPLNRAGLPILVKSIGDAATGFDMKGLFTKFGWTDKRGVQSIAKALQSDQNSMGSVLGELGASIDGEGMVTFNPKPGQGLDANDISPLHLNDLAGGNPAVAKMLRIYLEQGRK